MHKSIALWGHPRSVSTALERSFIERGDFTVFHEPFAYVYFMHEQRTDIPYKHPDPSHPRTYSGVKEMMENARKTRQVFHKNFPYHVIEHLEGDRGYLKSQINTFLIRNPEEAVLSHATVHPAVTRDVLGYAELFRLFDVVADLTGAAPIVINASDLTSNPLQTMRSYCQAIGIPFVDSALGWSSGEQSEWSTWKEWHKDAAGSEGITKPAKKYNVSYKDQPHLREFADYCQPFYEELNRYSLKPIMENVLCV